MTTRRIKSYTAETGLVWEYYFVGKRPAMGKRELSATEYVYDVSSDRQKTKFAVSVFVRQDGPDTWSALHGRSLGEAEEYAAAKMRLLRGFDEVDDMLNHGRELQVDAGNIDELLQPLKLD
jgi:hypothetical protein